MSKKVTQRRTAVYELEPDGFSIHTFELSMKLSAYQLTQIINALYDQQKEEKPNRAWIYPCDGSNHECTRYRNRGIRIILDDNRSPGEQDTCYLYMVINPRMLIDPDASYRGILSPKPDSIHHIQKAFQKLLKHTPFESDINAYQLRRIDQCTNLHCDHKKIFRETIRALRKLPTPPKYERQYSGLKNKKDAKDMDQHYIRFHCDTKDLVIYDKSYQLVKNRLVMKQEELPDGVLRFEVQHQRKGIRKIERSSGCDTVTELLTHFMEQSETMLLENFSRCFADVTFCRLDEIREQIQASGFRDKAKDAMEELSCALQRKQSVESAYKALEKKGIPTDGLLERFTGLGISPIPLRKNFCAKKIPGPVELLRNISSGQIPVAYEKVKYK